MIEAPLTISNSCQIRLINPWWGCVGTGPGLSILACVKFNDTGLRPNRGVLVILRAGQAHYGFYSRAVSDHSLQGQSVLNSPGYETFANIFNLPAKMFCISLRAVGINSLSSSCSIAHATFDHTALELFQKLLPFSLFGKSQQCKGSINVMLWIFSSTMRRRCRQCTVALRICQTFCDFVGRFCNGSCHPSLTSSPESCQEGTMLHRISKTLMTHTISI